MQAGGTPAHRAGSIEYAPKLAGAVRAPPAAAPSYDAGLPPVGDLFAPVPQLPLGLRPAPGHSAPYPSDAPRFAAWDSRRPHLTGRFL